MINTGIKHSFPAMRLTEAINIPRGVVNVIHPEVLSELESNNIHIQEILPELTDSDQSYVEMIASERYVELVRSLEQKLNKKLTRADMPQLFGAVYQLVDELSEIESSHKQALEKEAVNIVLELPEFTHVKELVDQGHLKINAKLGAKYTLDQLLSDPPNEENDLAPEEQMNELMFDALHDIDEKVLRRKFANTLIQGNAQNKAALYHLAKNQLDKIDQGLILKYGILLATTDLGFFAFPRPSGNIPNIDALGSAEIDSEQDSYTVTAYGAVFPILVHEITKGLMEFLSITGDSPDVARKVHAQADKGAHEHTDLAVGSKIDAAIRKFIPYDKLKYLPYIHKQLISTVPIEDIKEILRGDSKGEEKMRSILNNIIQSYE